MAGRGNDNVSELGEEDLYANQTISSGSTPTPGPAVAGRGAGATNLTRAAAATASRGWARGPIPVDKRKFKYDVTRAKSKNPLGFSVTKVDRMDALEAGQLLDKIHRVLEIDTAAEERILAFDRALWFEHTINGASMMQPGRGVITVDGMQLDLSLVKGFFGEDQRRFFRAFADDIAEANRIVLDSYDPYNFDSVEQVGQLRQVAAERGLHKYPHLAHDSSDACVSLSLEERMALIASKRIVIAGVVNKVDQFPGRVPESKSSSGSQVPVAASN